MGHRVSCLSASITIAPVQRRVFGAIASGVKMDQAIAAVAAMADPVSKPVLSAVSSAQCDVRKGKGEGKK